MLWPVFLQENNHSLPTWCGHFRNDAAESFKSNQKQFAVIAIYTFWKVSSFRGRRTWRSWLWVEYLLYITFPQKRLVVSRLCELCRIHILAMHQLHTKQTWRIVILFTKTLNMSFRGTIKTSQCWALKSGHEKCSWSGHMWRMRWQNLS